MIDEDPLFSKKKFPLQFVLRNLGRNAVVNFIHTHSQRSDVSFLDF